MITTETVRRQFTASDGAELHYKSWIPSTGATRALVLLHRGHEHADRWDSVVPGLRLRDTAIYAWEARGHGQSAGRRGHASGFMQYARDLADFMAHLEEAHGVKEDRVVLVAHSVGAVVAATWVHDYAPRLAGLVLATPAFDVNLIVPGALASIRMMQKVRPEATIKSYVKGHWLTRDEKAAAAYDADRSISKDISARVLVDLFDAARRVIRDAAVMDRPLLLFSAGVDRVVKRAAQDRFFATYGSPDKEHVTLFEARHAIFHDTCQDHVTTAIRAFAEKCFDAPAVPAPGVNLTHPATKAEYESLRKPLPALSPKRLMFGTQRLSMATLGKLSHGIQVGYRAGFDSGESLDYVYDNKSRGALGIGRLIDRGYLNAIGWRGIRQRRECMRTALRFCVESAAKNQADFRVMDIAGGAGRYLLDLLGSPWCPPGVSVLCRDWSETALATGRANAAALKLTPRITHERGDAFDGAALAAIRPRPSVAIVSGLYELFPDNDLLRRSLEGLFNVVTPDGWLIYTNQPWHPQVEMIARTLTNRDGEPWIMRRRPQSEMDALVAAAGFVKHRQWVDDFGIFTVSAARKPGNAP